MPKPGSAEEATLAVKVYKRVLYLMAEGFTEDQAYSLVTEEFDLDA